MKRKFLVCAIVLVYVLGTFAGGVSADGVQPLDAALAQTHPGRSISASVYTGGKAALYAGDTASFNANLNGYEGLAVSGAWQRSSGGGWSDVAAQLSFSITLDASNASAQWRYVARVSGYADASIQTTGTVEDASGTVVAAPGGLTAPVVEATPAPVTPAPVTPAPKTPAPEKVEPIVTEAPAAEEPAAEEPATEEPAAEEPAAEEPTAEEPAAEEPAAEEPGAEEPAADEPVVEESAAEEPASEEPMVEEPAAEEPAAEEPAAEEPVAEEPAAEEPAAEEPAAEEPAAEEPAVEEPTAEEPAAEEPAAEEPVVEEPGAEEPAAEEPVAEEPAVEEPVTEEPVAEEEIIAEDAPVAVEEPAAGDIIAETDEPAVTTITLYAAPSLDAAVLTIVDSSIQLIQIGREGDWAIVDFEGKPAYILSAVPQRTEVPEVPEEETALEEAAAEEFDAEVPTADEAILGVPLYEILDSQYPDRKIIIYAYWGENDYVEVGDQVQLTAELVGYEGLAYSLRWQYSQDGQGWSDLQNAVDSTYTFAVNESNYEMYWRIAVDIAGVAQ